MTDLIIDPEFRDLLPPLPDDKRKQLEENILQNGIREPLVLWQGILIDGHNRYEIAKRHNLTFTTVEYHFDDRSDVRLWIANNQFGRRDLNTYERSLLALKIKPDIAKKAKEKQIEAGGAVRQKSDKAVVDTKKEVAKLAGVSHDTIAKVEKIEAHATPEVKAAVKSGEISINTAYEGVKAGATTVEAVKEVKEKKPHVAFNSGNNEWYTPADIIEDARKVIGTITLDPASSEIANETVKATKFFTAEDDGLIQDWDGENIWLNPPYSSGLIEKFVDKLLASDYTQAIVLVNNATDTEWFSRLAEMAEAIVFPKGRVKFYKPDGTTGAPLQGQAILYFGDGADDFKKVFSKYGRCWQ